MFAVAVGGEVLVLWFAVLEVGMIAPDPIGYGSQLSWQQVGVEHSVEPTRTTLEAQHLAGIPIVDAANLHLLEDLGLDAELRVHRDVGRRKHRQFVVANRARDARFRRRLRATRGVDREGCLTTQAG